MEGIHKTVSLTRLVFELTLVGPPAEFLYKLIAVDGRVWKQTIKFDNPTNPLMTFSVVDLWRLSEFSSQRTLRNNLIALVQKYPSLEKIVYVF